MLILPKLIYKFNLIPIKTPSGFQMMFYKVIIGLNWVHVEDNFYWKIKFPRYAMKFFKEI